MKFTLSKIDNIIIFGGGSETTLKVLKYLKKTNFKFDYFTNTRQLEDIFPNNLSLRKNLEMSNINYIETNDINNNKLIYKKIKKTTLGFSNGQPWKFKKKLLKKFNGNFVDFMGIPLPMYRGGAHYSWMILNKNRYGGCFLQNVDDHTVQGQNDTNKYFLKKEYMYPKKLITPKDYFNYSSKIEINFLVKFFKKLKKVQSFNLKELDKKNLVLFPRLVSKINSYINWDLDVEEIVRFINAFSDPYPGAITFLGEKKVFLKNAKIYKRNHFHTYTSGIIANIFEKKLFICSKGGIFSVTCITLQNKAKENVTIGERFITDINYLRSAKKHKKF